MQSIWSEVKTVPEEGRTRAFGGWTKLGPLGMVNAGGGRYSGRILDIDVNDSIPIRLGAATEPKW